MYSSLLLFKVSKSKTFSNLNLNLLRYEKIIYYSDSINVIHKLFFFLLR